MTPWRNGSASDSRSEGCVFKSRRSQHFIYIIYSFIHFCTYNPLSFSPEIKTCTLIWLMAETLLRTQISQFTGCPKFVPLISFTITFEQNFISTSVKISKRCLLLYRVLVFRSSVTGMPPLFRCLFLFSCFCFCFFFFNHFPLRRCGMECR